MIEVRIPKEIKDYKTKYFFNMTLRQTITTFLAIVICVPLYLFGRAYMSEDLLSWIILIIALPIMMIGWFSFNQMTFEQFILVWFRMHWNRQKRPYQYLPVFSYIRDEYLKQQRREIFDFLSPNRKKNDTQ